MNWAVAGILCNGHISASIYDKFNLRRDFNFNSYIVFSFFWDIFVEMFLRWFLTRHGCHLSLELSSLNSIQDDNKEVEKSITKEEEVVMRNRPRLCCFGSLATRRSVSRPLARWSDKIKVMSSKDIIGKKDWTYRWILSVCVFCKL